MSNQSAEVVKKKKKKSLNGIPAVEQTLEENNSLMDMMDTHINTMQRK